MGVGGECWGQGPIVRHLIASWTLESSRQYLWKSKPLIRPRVGYYLEVSCAYPTSPLGLDIVQTLIWGGCIREYSLGLGKADQENPTSITGDESHPEVSARHGEVLEVQEWPFT